MINSFNGSRLITLAIAALSLFSHTYAATPDCYDFSVTTQNDTFIEMLPKLLFYGHVDQMQIQRGKNCGFYTYGDVFFKSYHRNVTGIYFTFNKTTALTCELDPRLRTFKNESWLYANSLNADPTVCGYYVGVANAAPIEADQMFQIIRSAGQALAVAVVALGLSVAIYL